MLASRPPRYSKPILSHINFFVILTYMIYEVTISARNQITLPAAIMRSQKLRPGQKLYIKEQKDVIILTPKNSSEKYAGIMKNDWGKNSAAKLRKIRNTDWE